MAVLDLKYFGDDVLREASSEIVNLDEEMVQFARDLIETMHVKKGIGLAANQVGRPIRAYAVDPSGIDPEEKAFVIFNPRIIEVSGEQTIEEGCLSFPGLYETVTRPEKAIVEGINIDGNPIRLVKEGLYARILLHEYDHLEGKLFIDHFSLLKKQLYNRKLKRLKAGELEVFR
ncbi:MAG: peptide deformylase [candidate division Zixibacteria bacterium]|nr:peptide deformylase [candidate division Zixibacteria bacterium]